MNDINQVVFNVYKNLMDSDYTKNQDLTIFDNFKKFIRYLLSGYIFEVKNVRKQMNKMNEFSPSDKQYEKKVVVYTTCYGNYDSIKNPIYINANYDYYIFTDQDLPSGTVWEKYDLPSENLKSLTNVEKSRLCKLMPHIFFKEYDYSIYIDSNILITCNIDEIINTMIEENKCIALHQHQVRDCVYREAKAIYASGKAKWKDLKQQINCYANDGFPKNFGLFENNIIFRKHNEKQCIKVMEKWWAEFNRFATKRDQLSFMYSLWINGFTSNFVMSLGNNSRRNPYFIVGGHN